MERLKSHREFVAVLKRRKKTGEQDLIAHVLIVPCDDGDTPKRRLGLAVSKAVGNAVQRNSVKRRLRVCATAHEHLLPEQCDIVLRAKPSAAHTSFQSLDAQVANIFAQVARMAQQA